MRNEFYKKMYSEYQKGFSLAEVGKMFNMSRQGVFGGFKKRGFKCRKKIQLPYQFFDNKKFTLRNHGYYSLTSGKRTLMHRYVWEKEKGKIPIGYDIHHIDLDRTNNDIKNLECISKSEHTKLYSPHHNQYKNNKTKHLYENNKRRVFKKDGTKHKKTN